MYKRTHVHVCTQTHTYMHINTDKKLATEHKEEESVCSSQVIRESALFSHGICFLLTHRTPAFLQICHPENAAERYIRRQEWSEMLHARTGYHELKDRLCVIGKMSFPRFANILEFAH